jgi:hypothetical protein
MRALNDNIHIEPVQLALSNAQWRFPPNGYRHDSEDLSRLPTPGRDQYAEELLGFVSHAGHRSFPALIHDAICWALLPQIATGK